MPTPGTKQAPCFKGRRVQDFLDDLETHADNARLPYTSLSAFIPRYCCDKVWRLIRRSSVWTKNDWTADGAYLEKLYDYDEEPRITADKLRTRVRRHADERSFTSLADVYK